MKLINFTLGIVLILSLISTFAINACVAGIVIAQVILDGAVNPTLAPIVLMAPGTFYALVRVYKESKNKECNSFLNRAFKTK